MKTSSTDTLTAADIMQQDMIVINRRETFQDAMDLMTGNHITGLPVVDARNRCIGIVSATDILNFEQEHSEFTSEVNANLARHYDADTGLWESVRVTSFALEEFAELAVEEVMATNVVSVERETPLVEVAKKMIQEKIHRVLVMGENQILYGIITSSDFVRCYAEEA